MQERIRARLLESAQLKQRVAQEMDGQIAQAAQMLIDAYQAGRKAIIFGNGGSAADAQHFAAELVGRFVLERRGLPCVALNCNASSLTAISNDYGFDEAFARQVEAFAEKDDVVIGISTSGTSTSILRALERARGLGARTIGLSGKSGGSMRQVSDLCLVVPHEVTARIQESHIAILHIWCELVEEALFAKK